MSQSSSEKATVVVGVIIRNQDVLIVQRQTIESGKGSGLLHWVFPGGTVEENETEEGALKREVLEETGYSVEVTQHIDTRRHPQFPVCIGYYLCTVDSEQILTFKTEEIREIRWIPIRELKEYFTSNLNPAVTAILETL
jgi:mutator protein MutT